MKRWDIFCKIVDNFGDIGVCWRLAKQLQTEHKLQIRLWIDDLNVAKQLIPSLDPTKQEQLIQDITIASWQADTSFDEAAEVALEAFGCELPTGYLAHMHAKTIWINLEYLSAESWVEDFHARNSKRGNLTRHFFFPGFTANTGGLLREHDIVSKNQLLASNSVLKKQFLQDLHIQDNSRLKVSLFCYPHAPIHALLTAMADSSQPTDCYVPAGSILPIVGEFFDKNELTIGETLTLKSLQVHVLPFLSQADYDMLLACCDINFVRGEDSWIRAIWAGKPFIWQPYQQTEDTHATKLNAFLDLFYADCNSESKERICQLHDAWVAGNMTTAIWQGYLNHLTAIGTHTSQRTKSLATQPDLATNLVIFIEKIHHNKI